MPTKVSDCERAIIAAGLTNAMRLSSKLRHTDSYSAARFGMNALSSRSVPTFKWAGAKYE